MAEHWSRRARRWVSISAMPTAVLALALLLMQGTFAQSAETGLRIASWAFLVAAGVWAALRQARRKLSGARAPARWTVESCALSAVGALGLAQLGGGLSSPLYPLMYLLAAGYALALPLRFSLPALGWLLGLDAGLFLAQGALPLRWPLLAAHAGFSAVFAALYHGVRAGRRARRGPPRPVAGRRPRLVTLRRTRARPLFLRRAAARPAGARPRRAGGRSRDLLRARRGAGADLARRRGGARDGRRAPAGRRAQRERGEGPLLPRPRGAESHHHGGAGRGLRGGPGPRDGRAGPVRGHPGRGTGAAGRPSAPPRAGRRGRRVGSPRRAQLRRQSRVGRQRRAAGSAAARARAAGDGAHRHLRFRHRRARPRRAEDLPSARGRGDRRHAGVRHPPARRAPRRGASRAGHAGPAGGRGAGPHALVRAGRAARHHRRPDRPDEPPLPGHATCRARARGAALSPAPLAAPPRR